MHPYMSKSTLYHVIRKAEGLPPLSVYTDAYGKVTHIEEGLPQRLRSRPIHSLIRYVSREYGYPVRMIQQFDGDEEKVQTPT